MNERVSTNHDDSHEVEARMRERNAEIERRLNSNLEHPLPEADVYPILGATFSRADLAQKYPIGSKLPVEQAVESGQNVSLMLGTRDSIVAGMILTPENGLDSKTLSVIDTYATEEWHGQGYGQKLYLEALKALPSDVEMTSHDTLLPDGQRMWDKLVAADLAHERDVEQVDGDVAGQYVTHINDIA